MKSNHIIEELHAKAALDWHPEQKAYFEQQAKDAKIVECVRMRDVFTAGQMAFLREHYVARQKMCYKNASQLVELMSCLPSLFPEPGKYVEGFSYCYGLLPIEHAFVKVGDVYIDPTFERALHRDVRREEYVSLIELDGAEMARLQAETGYYGELYLYDYLKRYRPELAARMAARM